MNGPTARQTEAWEALQRHGGRATHGAASAAARELRLTAGAFASAVIGYERHNAAGDQPRRTARQTLASVPERLDAIEARLDQMAAAEAARDVLLANLADEIRRWTGRQPILIEARPSHRRKADGGQSVRAELREIRKAVGG